MFELDFTVDIRKISGTLEVATVGSLNKIF